MAEDDQKFLHNGVPVFGTAFYILNFIIFVLLCRAWGQGRGLSKNADIGAKALMGLCLMQSFAGYFFLFSLAQAVGFTLMMVPFLGMFAFYTVERHFLVFFAAIEIFLLSFVHSFYQTLAAGKPSCNATFGDDDYCPVGWRSFLMWVTLMYQWSLMAAGFGAYFFFVHGTIDSSPVKGESANIKVPLLSEESN